MRQNHPRERRYDLLAINLAMTIASTLVLIAYCMIALATVVSVYVVTPYTPFDFDFSFDYVIIVLLGVVISTVGVVSGIFGALACAWQLNILTWVVTGFTLIFFLLTIITPLLFFALL